MTQSGQNDNHLNDLSLKLAIVGGGRTCKSFLKILKDHPFSYLNVNIGGVCDINPEAEGLRFAKEMGLFTTRDFRDLFDIEGLNGIIELANSREVLLDLIRLKPKGVGVLEHNIGRFMEGLLKIDQKLKSSEQQVKLERMAADFLIQQANERIVVLNPDFTIVDANALYLKAVNKPREEVIGAHCYEITHGLKAPCSGSRPDLGCPMTETLHTGEAAQVIHEHPSTGELPTYCDMVTYPIVDQDGKIIRVIEVWRDITEALASRWEKRINELKDDFKKLIQEDRMISLGKLAASCVHEINNPIQGLLTFSDLMLKTLEQGAPGPDDLKEFQKYLFMMSKELERCGNIISGLLSFSRQSAIGTEKVFLNKVLEEVVELTRHKMELQDIQIKTRLSTEPLIVSGDANQLQQCFLNLIFNAIESMPNGGDLIISSELDRSHGLCEVRIRDTGCGIAEKNLDHIFDPFFTTKEEGQGTGLGLSIVHGLVKSYEGEIKVKSRPGEGTTFSVYLPVT